jgi:hypothetical protein
MRRRLILAAVLELVLMALVAGMFAFSIHMVRQERDWREQGMQAGPIAEIAMDVSDWWLKYWWTAAPLLVLGGVGLAAVVVFTGQGRPRGPAAAR